MVRSNRRYSWNYNLSTMKIATHDSATGEKSKNLLHSLVKIFAQTQTKTIKEQYEAGVRYFDFRVDKDLVLCHGLWKSNKTLADILSEIKSYAQEIVYIRVIIERKYSEEVYKDNLKMFCCSDYKSERSERERVEHAPKFCRSKILLLIIFILVFQIID